MVLINIKKTYKTRIQHHTIALPLQTTPKHTKNKQTPKTIKSLINKKVTPIRATQTEFETQTQYTITRNNHKTNNY